MSYTKEQGYAKFSSADYDAIGRQVALNRQLTTHYLREASLNRILIAGMGQGIEAISVCHQFSAWSVGIDINPLAGQLFASDFPVITGDVTHLSFKDDSFDFVYCNHVLEHVGDARKALLEIGRVLKKGGLLFAGFPNRRRLVAYIGTSDCHSFFQFLAWNARDYGFRIRGKFRNECGAHAGFTTREFMNISENIFSRNSELTDRYFELKYPRFLNLIRLISRFRLGEMIFPSKYFICIK